VSAGSVSPVQDPQGRNELVIDVKWREISGHACSRLLHGLWAHTLQLRPGPARQ
jgi:hypothetical protein